MVKNIHFVVVGREDIFLHLAGIPKFKADEVILIDCHGRGKVDKIVKSLQEMGIAYRVIPAEKEYLDVYKKASVEVAASLTDDCCVIVNMSTGPKMVLMAIEDAVRIQLYFFYNRVYGKTNCSAFRYVTKRAKERRFEIAPIWNFFREDYNLIFEVLAEAPEPIPLKKIYQLISDVKSEEEMDGYEAFRKTFRKFKGFFQNNPCFKEKVHKNPRYKVELM